MKCAGEEASRLNILFIERNETFFIILVGKFEGKRLLSRLGCRWDDNVNLKEIGCEGVH